MLHSKQLVQILVLLFLLVSCQHTKREEGSTAIDLQQIIDSDTLRVATTYGPTSYFLYRDELMGYDFELAENLARKLKLKLKISVANNEDEMIRLLREKKVDLVCANITETKDLKNEFSFIIPQRNSYQVLVQSVGLKTVSNVTELAGKDVYVKNNSIFHKRLEAINSEIGGGINIILAADSLSNTDLIDLVGEKKIPYTLANRKMALLYKSYYGGLDCRMPVSFQQRNGWLIRTECPELKKAVEAWYSESRMLKIQARLFEKYWVRNPYFRLRSISIPKGAISPFDHLFKKYAPLIGWDWRLLAALAFHESGFDPTEISWAGAAGLMQLMPRTASNFGLNRRTIFDPELNIEASVQYIKSLNMTFRQIESSIERKKFILAAYNTGPAHVLDAMALAKKYGRNPHIWFDHVDYYLLKKSDPKYYQDKVVKYGYFRGKGSAQYVNRTLDTFHKYSNRK